MTPGEIAALATAITAVVTAVAGLLSLVGHLIHHKQLDQAQTTTPPAGNNAAPRP